MAADLKEVVLNPDPLQAQQLLPDLCELLLGRRPVLLVALLVFTIACMGCAFAPNVQV